MNRIAVVILGFAVAAALLARPAMAASPDAPDPTRLIVKFRDPVTTPRSAAFARLLTRYGLVDAGPLIPPRAAARARSKRPPTPAVERRRDRLNAYALLRASRPLDVEAIAAELRMLGEVESAEPDQFIRQAGSLAPSTSATDSLPNDPFFQTHQWGFHNTGDQITEPPQLPRRIGADVHAVEAWRVTTGSHDVIVAVLDTGIRTDHPELADRIWQNADEIPGNGIDDDANGYVDDVNGFNFAGSNPVPYDDQGHGTACAGIIAADANNGTLVAGLDWSCRLMPLKVLPATGVGSLSNLARGIVYAADNGADVLSISLGGYGGASVLGDACAYAHDEGVFMAAAMMNDNSPQPAYPAALPTVAGVGSTDPADQRCTPEVSGYGSNYGPHIDVVAPGVSIPVLSVGSPTGMTLGAGTSFSTPMVAGLGALLRAARPDLTADQTRDLIRYSAADLVGRPSEDTPGFDIYHGWGRIDCARALALAATTGFPSITAPAFVRGVEGAEIEFDVSASDPDGDPIDSLGVDGALPVGAAFLANAEQTQGRFTWMPSYAQAGSYELRFRAANPFEATASTVVEVLDVPNPPMITVPSIVRGTEGALLETAIEAVDPDGDPMTSFTCTGLPAGAVFTTDESLTHGVLTWTPDNSQSGWHLVTFTASSLDPLGPLGVPLIERASANLSLFIEEGPDQPPVISLQPDQVEGNEGSALAVDVSVSDADGDPITSLAAAPLPAGATFDVAPDARSGHLAWTPDFSQAGDYEIQISAESSHRATGVSEPVVTRATVVLPIRIADTPRPLARAFPDPQDRMLRLLSPKPAYSLHIEPIQESFELATVVLDSVLLISTGTGDVDRILAIGGKSVTVGDADRNGVQDIPVSFAKEDLRHLFSKVPAGRHRVPVAVEAPLLTGGRLHAELDLDVAGAPGNVTASATPNPLRPGGRLLARVPSMEAARVRLFDASGRQVRTWSVHPANGGYIDLSLDRRDAAGRDLAGGIYFYRIETPSVSASGRLVLVR